MKYLGSMLYFTHLFWKDSFSIQLDMSKHNSWQLIQWAIDTHKINGKPKQHSYTAVGSNSVRVTAMQCNMGLQSNHGISTYRVTCAGSFQY